MDNHNTMSAAGGKDAEKRGFVNDYTHYLDPKRRLTIPSEWRDLLGTPSSLYVLPDLYEKCLRAFTIAGMERYMVKIREIPMSDRKGRELMRELGRQSNLVEPDSQGRIRIKDQLLEFAQLVDQVVLVGTFDSFEIWEPNNLGRITGVDQSKLQEAARYAGI